MLSKKSNEIISKYDTEKTKRRVDYGKSKAITSKSGILGTYFTKPY